MRKSIVSTINCLATIGMLLLSGSDISLNAQSQPTVIPVNIDGYLQNPNVSVTVNWQLQQSIQWYSDQYEFKATSVAPVPGDTTAPPDAFYRHFPDPNDTFCQLRVIDDCAPPCGRTHIQG